MKGLIAAGGNATRLEELTRVTNKHLLPVGRWPMVYYPLQLLQRRRRARGAARHRPAARGPVHRPARQRPRRARARATRCSSTSISRTRCRSRPAASRRWSAWRATSQPASSSSCASATTSSSTRRPTRSRRGTSGAMVFVEGGARTRRTSASSPTATTGSVADIVEKAGVVDTRYDAPPSNDAVVGLYCYPPDVFEIIDGARAVEPRRARDHRRQPRLRAARRARGAARRRLVARRRQALGRPRRRRPADRGDGSEQVVVTRIPLTRHRRRARLVHGADARERAAEAGAPGEPRALAAGRDPRAALPRARPGRSLLCLEGMVRVVVLEPRDRRDVHGGHRRREPGRDLRRRASTRTATRR